MCAVSLSSGAKGLPTVSTPTLSVPAVSTPAVTVPSVTVPSVTVPSVTVPSVTVPAVKTPVVSTPAVTTPQVTTPHVSTPSVTTPSSASVKTPSSLPSSGQSSPGSAAGSSASAPGTTSSSGSAQASASSRNERSSVTKRTGGASAGRRTSARKQAAEDRRLRALVNRDQGCLNSLNPTQDELLALRAGVGGTQPHSASVVARALHVSLNRESQIEQRALSSLRSEARGGCPAGAPAAFVITGPNRLVPVATWLPSTTNASATTPAAAAPTGSRSGHSKTHRHAKSTSSEPSSTPNSVDRADVGGHGSSSDLDAVLLVCLLALGAATVIALPGTRRRLLAAAPARGSLESGRPRELTAGSALTAEHSDRWLPPGASSEPPAELTAGSAVAGGQAERWLPTSTDPGPEPKSGSVADQEPAGRWLPSGTPSPDPAPAATVAPIAPAVSDPIPPPTPAPTTSRPAPTSSRPAPTTSRPAPTSSRLPARTADTTPSRGPARHSWMRSRVSETALLGAVAGGGLRLLIRAIARRSR